MSDAIFRQALLTAVRPWDLELADAQLDLLWAHFARMIEANRSFNLTRVTDPADAAATLYADSLSIVCWARANGANLRQVIDIGTGAGFPAVPLAIARPDWCVTAIDGTAKKVRFLAECAASLGIGNLRALHVRAEHWRPTPPADLTTAKAVGSTVECLRFGAKLLRPGGFMAAFKTPRAIAAEQAAAVAVAKSLGFTPQAPFPYQIATAQGPIERVLLIFEKLAAVHPRRRAQARRRTRRSNRA